MRFFGASLGLQILALTVLIVIPLLMPQRFEIVQHYWVTPLERPVIQPWKPQPVRKTAVVKREVVKEVPKPPEIEAPKPKIYIPVISSPIARVAKRKATPTPQIVAKALPNPMVSMGSSAIPTLKRPREPVQTGGLGDPHGVPDNGKRDRNPNIARLGSFALPAGEGYGNGMGGKKGERGIVASAGFGNGQAVAGAGAAHGSVEQGLFASEQAPTGPKIRRVAEVSNTKPVEILSVPRPVYTQEARDKKIEGIVLLQVTFTATGEVKVQRVVQGLGYGLNEAAEAAARQIRFRPALQDGQPVDSSAVARIVFQLAY